MLNDQLRIIDDFASPKSIVAFVKIDDNIDSQNDHEDNVEGLEYISGKMAIDK
jgi:hypothetical protein